MGMCVGLSVCWYVGVGVCVCACVYVCPVCVSVWVCVRGGGLRRPGFVEINCSRNVEKAV